MAGRRPRSRRCSTGWKTCNAVTVLSAGRAPEARTRATSNRTSRTSHACVPLTLRTALGEIGPLLDGLSIRWALIGGLAANRFRRSPRHTDDVDLLLADAGPGLETLESTLTAAGWSVQRADPMGDLLRVRHAEFGRVDLLVAGTAYQHEALQRALAAVERVPGAGTVPALTVEDVIVHKLIAGRYRDLADIEEILESNPTLEEHYIERWAEFWEVLDRWQVVGTGRS